MSRTPSSSSKRNGPWQRSTRRVLASITALVLVAALLIASLLVFEITLPLDGQRERIARAMSDTLGVPVAISGSIKLHTGLRAGLEVSGLRIGSAESSGDRMLDAARLDVRVQTIALLRKDIRIVDAVAEGAVVCVRGGNERPPSPAGVQPRQAPSWVLSDIAHLQARQLSVVIDPTCDPARRLAELQTVEMSAPQGTPARISARAVLAGEQFSVEAQGPSLAALVGQLADQPFELSANFAEATARVSGRIDLARLAFAADVAFQAPQFVAVIRPLGAPFKEFGPLSARARVTGDRGGLKVQFDEVSIVPVTATAEVELDWSGPRPGVTVALNTGQLDVNGLRDWLDRSLDAGRTHPGGTWNQAIAALRASDGRFAIGIQQLKAGATTLAGISWDGSWSQGDVKTHARGTLSQATIVASLNADLHGAPVVSASASAHKFVFPGGLGVAGVIGSLDLDYVARGVSGENTAFRSRAVVVARSAKLVVALGKGRKVPLDLARARVEWREGESLVGEAAGTVFGESVRAKLDGTDIGALWHDRPWALRVSGEVASLRIASEGDLALGGGQVDADLRFDLHADRLGRPVSGNLAALPMNAQGAVGVHAGNWRVDLRRLEVGNTDASGWAAGGRSMSAPFQGEARFGTLDLAQLATGPAGAQPGGFVLPRNVTLPAADLVLSASRVVLPGAVATNARIDAGVRDGRLDQVPFGFELDGAAVRGALSADLSGPSARIALSADAADIDERLFGRSLTARGIVLRLGALNVVASSTGNEAGELTSNARAEVTVQRAALTMAERGAAPAISADVSAATLSAKPGQPTQLTLDGELQDLPAHIEASLPALADLWHSADAVFRAGGRLDRIEVGVAGSWPGPGPEDRPVHVSVAAPTLTAFDRVLGHELPSTGPFRLEADLLGLEGEHPSASANVSLGESQVGAQLAGHLSGDRPRWDLDLTSPRLRLEDFGSAEYIDDLPQPGEVALRPDPPSVKAQGRAQSLLQRIVADTRPALQRFDARARLAVERITSGADDLGTAAVQATLDSGRLRIAPLSLVGPRGELRFAADADLSAQTVPFTLDVNLSRFEYGRLMQSIDPKRDEHGELSFRMKLKGDNGVEGVARSLDGRAGLLILPTTTGDLRMLDRWGGGLLRNLGATLDSAQSRLNCAVATFGVARGIARSEALMLDTTRMRAAGDLEVDLQGGGLHGLFASKTKRAELFSARVPVTIGGTLAAPKIAPASGSLLVTSVRYLFSAYAYLFDTIDSAPYVPDGTPDCVAIYTKLQE